MTSNKAHTTKCLALLVIALLAIDSGYKLLKQPNARNSRKIRNTKKEPLISLSPLHILEDNDFLSKNSSV